MKFKSIIAISTCVAMLSSCAVTTPFMVTNNDLGTKTGVSTTTSIFGGGRAIAGTGAGRSMYSGLMFNKEFGIVEAAKNGKITKIGAIDYKVTRYVLFSKLEIIVAGE